MRWLLPTTWATRARSAPRHARNSQDTKSSYNILALQTAVLRIMGKTFSSEAAAGTVPAACGSDPESSERARSEQMRSMFSVLVCLFEPSPGDRVAGPRVGKKKVRECARVFRLHARGRNGPGTPAGSTRGLRGRRQRPAGGTRWHAMDGARADFPGGG